VYVPAGDTAINSNQITDKRVFVNTPGGGGGAGTGLSYVTKVAEGTLSNEFALGSLATGLLINTTTTGVPTIYAGTSCTTHFPRSLTGVAPATCASVSPTNDMTGTLQAAQFPALTGDVTTSAGSLATSLSTTGVSGGTYGQVTVDTKGRVTAATT